MSASALSATATTAAHTDGSCDRRTSVTRSLLGYGILVGPAYTVVSLSQALTRQGFDIRRHQWSLLENGDLGWIQMTNFLVSGAMLVAYAVGLRRALAGGVGSRWVPRLTAVFGLCLAAAGIFTADPALGFPAGTPDGPGRISWHGLVHFTAAGIGFVAIAASCFVLARRYGGQGRRGVARYSRATGLGFLAGFFCVASGAGSTVANLSFVGAVVALWAWVTTVALDTYHSARVTARP
jgi:Protein of unknown function (DUF998)